MKKILTLFGFSLVTLTLNAQGVEINYYPDGDVDVSGTIIEFGVGEDFINEDFNIVNVSGSTKELRIERVKIIELEGSEDFMYWGTAPETADGYSAGIVSPQNPFTSPHTAETEDGDDAWLSTNFVPNGIAGCAQHRYYVIDETDTRLDSVDIRYCSTASINEGKKTELSVYPNPSINGNFTVSFENVNEVAVVVVINALGETVRNEVVNGTNNTIVTIEDKGIYFISLRTEDGETIATERAVVQ